MDYEWDAPKAEANLRKHKVDFADAVGVFDDPFALSMPDPDAREERLLAIGTDMLGRTLVVVYTHRGERIRIISARHASPAERRAYEQGDP